MCRAVEQLGGQRPGWTAEDVHAMQLWEYCTADDTLIAPPLKHDDPIRRAKGSSKAAVYKLHRR
jgi:hypothetical protein